MTGLVSLECWPECKLVFRACKRAHVRVRVRACALKSCAEELDSRASPRRDPCRRRRATSRRAAARSDRACRVRCCAPPLPPCACLRRNRGTLEWSADRMTELNGSVLSNLNGHKRKLGWWEFCASEKQYFPAVEGWWGDTEFWRHVDDKHDANTPQSEWPVLRRRDAFPPFVPGQDLVHVVGVASQTLLQQGKNVCSTESSHEPDEENEVIQTGKCTNKDERTTNDPVDRSQMWTKLSPQPPNNLLCPLWK